MQVEDADVGVQGEGAFVETGVDFLVLGVVAGEVVPSAVAEDGRGWMGEWLPRS